MTSQTARNSATADALAKTSSANLPGRIAAAEAIREGIRRWTNDQYTDGVQLPIIRINLVLCKFGSTADDPIEHVLKGSVLQSEKAVAKMRDQWAEYACRLRQCARAGSLIDEAELRDLAKHGRRGRTDAERHCIAMGVSNALAASLNLQLEATERRIAQLNAKVEEQPRKRGRERNLAAYAVAAALAQLFAKITGRRPTYSESHNGVSGEYTPVLRDVFDALGWKAADLRGPARAAVLEVTEADLYPHEMMKLLGLPPSLLIRRTEN